MDKDEDIYIDYSYVDDNQNTDNGIGGNQEKYLGLPVYHWFFILAGILTSLILAHAFWQYCLPESDEPDPTTKPEHLKQIVVIKEVRPGLILLEGYPTKEETLRIAHEYDVILGRESSRAEVRPPWLLSGISSHGPDRQIDRQRLDGNNESYEIVLEERPPPYVPHMPQPVSENVDLLR